MSLKVKHLRHPMRATAVAGNLLATQLNTLKFARLGVSRYGSDPRYNLQNVTDGYAPQPDDHCDDTELLERICTAYVKAVNHPHTSCEIFKATEWWRAVRRDHLGPVIRALTTHDTSSLQVMYRNFFRESCSAGLFHRPLNISGSRLGTTISNINRRFILGDALYRLDYWKVLTNNKFTVADLAGPAIGNPFGVLAQATLVRMGTEYQHYCAEKVRSHLDNGSGNVVEIGGGFGGAAYYLLRNQSPIKYLDFDVPESIALTSYYLIKAFPELSFLLYGEGELNSTPTPRFDVALMPLFEMSKIEPGSIDMTFSSHAMSDIHKDARTEYLQQIRRTTRGHFWYIGDGRAGQSIQAFIAEDNASFALAEKRSAEWNNHRVSNPNEVELLYRIGNH